MPSWKSPTAVDPNGDDAARYRLLEDEDPETASRLMERYAPRWLRRGGLPISRLAEVDDTVELKVADSWDPPDGTRVLRITSWYTGETRWLYDWRGDFESAAAWIDDSADIFGDWIDDERAIRGPRTPWEPPDAP